MANIYSEIKRIERASDYATPTHDYDTALMVYARAAVVERPAAASAVCPRAADIE